MHPDFSEILDAVEESGLWLYLETNGKLLSEPVVRRLGKLSRGIRCWTLVSLDSHRPELHDRCRGHGSFEAAVQAIRALRCANISVQISKLVSPGDFAEGFDLDPFVEFCKADLGASGVKISRVLPTGRASDDRFTLTDSQVDEVCQWLRGREEFGKYLFSTDFILARDAQDCRRLTGGDRGVWVTPQGIHPCNALQEVVLAGPEELAGVEDRRLQEKFARLRATALLDADPDLVWGCPECRRATLGLRGQVKPVLA